MPDNSTVDFGPEAWNLFQQWMNTTQGTNSKIQPTGESSVTFGPGTQNLFNDWISTGTPQAQNNATSKNKYGPSKAADTIGQEIMRYAVMASILIIVFAALSMIG